MDCRLQRIKYLESGIFSKMIVGDDVILFCLEHAFCQQDGTFTPKVPKGVYKCTRYNSPKFGYVVFILNDVPGADFIEIHRGNFNSSSDGCICLGESFDNSASPTMICNSRVSFDYFMSLQSGVDEFTLTVE